MKDRIKRLISFVMAAALIFCEMPMINVYAQEGDGTSGANRVIITGSQMDVSGNDVFSDFEIHADSEDDLGLYELNLANGDFSYIASDGSTEDIELVYGFGGALINVKKQGNYTITVGVTDSDDTTLSCDFHDLDQIEYCELGTTFTREYGQRYVFVKVPKTTIYAFEDSAFDFDFVCVYDLNLQMSRPRSCAWISGIPYLKFEAGYYIFDLSLIPNDYTNIWSKALPVITNWEWTEESDVSIPETVSASDGFDSIEHDLFNGNEIKATLEDGSTMLISDMNEEYDGEVIINNPEIYFNVSYKNEEGVVDPYIYEHNPGNYSVVVSYNVNSSLNKAFPITVVNDEEYYGEKITTDKTGKTVGNGAIISITEAGYYNVCILGKEQTVWNDFGVYKLVSGNRFYPSLDEEDNIIGWEEDCKYNLAIAKDPSKSGIINAIYLEEGDYLLRFSDEYDYDLSLIKAREITNMTIEGLPTVIYKEVGVTNAALIKFHFDYDDGTQSDDYYSAHDLLCFLDDEKEGIKAYYNLSIENSNLDSSEWLSEEGYTYNSLGNVTIPTEDDEYYWVLTDEKSGTTERFKFKVDSIANYSNKITADGEFHKFTFDEELGYCLLVVDITEEESYKFSFMDKPEDYFFCDPCHFIDTKEDQMLWCELITGYEDENDKYTWVASYSNTDDSKLKAGLYFFYDISPTFELRSITDVKIEVAPQVPEIPDIILVKQQKNDIAISWSKSEGALGYEISISEDFGPYRVLTTVNDGSTSYTDRSSHKNGVSYTYTVSAFNEKGKSDSSKPLSCTYVGTVAVSNLSNTSTGVIISWDKNTLATGYEVLRKTGTEAYRVIATITSGSTLKYIDKTAESGNSYTYAVATISGDIKTNAGKGAEITYLAQPKIAKSSGKCEKSVIAWNKIPGADGYYVYRKVGSGAYSLLSTISSGSTATFTDTKVTLGKNYTYKVVAKKGNYKSAESAEATVKITSHTYTKKVTPATTTKDGKIVYTCSDCQKKKTEVISAAKTIKLAKTEYDYTGKEIKPKVTINDSTGKAISSSYYTVTYSNNKNIGTASVKITFKGNYTGSVTKKFKINPVVTKVSKISSLSKGFKINVTVGKGAEGYEVQYSTSNKFKTVSKKTYKAATKSVTYGKLKAKTTYYVRVRSYKNVKESGKTVKYYSGWSTTVAVKTRP